MLSGLFKSFRDVKAVSNLHLSRAPGEIVCLLRSSGCGKTTTLRLIAGLDLIAGFDARDAGTIDIENRLVAGPGVNEAPEKRRVGMEFQEGALVSHLSVAHNVAFGLEKGRQRVNFRERECWKSRTPSGKPGKSQWRAEPVGRGRICSNHWTASAEIQPFSNSPANGCGISSTPMTC